MARCSYCGCRVDSEAIHLDGEVFCSDSCLEDYGTGSYDNDAEDTYEDDAYDYRDQ